MVKSALVWSSVLLNNCGDLLTNTLKGRVALYVIIMV